MAETTEEPNLEKLRDEKCVPIARGMLNDMAVEMIPVDANVEIDFRPVVLKMLTRTLDADANIATDIPYIFQLIKGVFMALSATVQQVQPKKQIDDVRFGAIMKKILGIVATANIRMAEATPDTIKEDFMPVKEQLQTLFDAEEMSFLEIKYCMDNIFSSFDRVTDNFKKNIDIAVDKASSKAMGVEFMSDVSMRRLDEFLKAPVEEVK